jgi:hypothetical protein
LVLNMMCDVSQFGAAPLPQLGGGNSFGGGMDDVHDDYAPLPKALNETGFDPVRADVLCACVQRVCDA